MVAAASSSSSAALPPKQYDVFISFTENYASSKWCLDELTQILQCRKEEGQMVIPIFYKVDPSDVRKQNGSYKEAFAKHERDFVHNLDKVNIWKDALSQTADLAGWDSRIYRDEYELIQNIVNDILKKLYVKYPSALESLVGIDENCKRIESLLEEVPTIGIWGMGGIGKTTMARAVFTKLSSQYESCCFLENVREMSERHGLNYIRDKLVKELLTEEISHGSTSKVSEFEFVRRRLSHKKVFIVLDDVSSSKDLDDLARECGCLGPGSRVIITTRDKHVLIGRVKKIYEAKSLSYHQSLNLFSMKAFHKNQPENGYEELSESFVIYANGIPLALEVFGSFLYSKKTEEWNSALAKIEKTPDGSIQRALKLSYDGLDYEEKKMFLDIACFLEGEDKEKVITLFESFGYHASIGIRSLLDKALITIDHYQLRMHDLIKETGREFVRQECIREPGRRSRLWDHEDIYEVLKNNKGTDRVESIISNVFHMRHVSLSANTFQKIANLRFLKFYSSSYEISSNVNLPSGLESFSDRLRYIQWDGYPLESLPATFCAENLVELHMRGSSLKKIWDGMQDLVNLKIVNLQRSVQLVELPDFFKAPNLELVDLSFCQSLCNVHPSILSLPSLDTLRLFRCSSLKSLHSERHSKSLRTLDVLGCHSLNKFSLS